MKNKYFTRSFIYIFLLAVILNVQSFAQTGYLHRSGKKILDGNNNEIILKGIGIGGWMIQESYMMLTSGFASTQHALKAKITDVAGVDGMNAFYDAWLANGVTKSDIDSLKKWGFNSIRIPMHYNLFTLPIESEPVVGQNTWLDKGFTIVDSVLKWCGEDQIYVILDMHAAPGGQGRDAAISDYDTAKSSLWENANNQSKLVALWQKLADRYKDEPWIGGYDLINEPNWDFENSGNINGCNCVSNTPLKNIYQQIITAIRSVDTHHMVIIEGNCWGNNYTGLTTLMPSTYDANLAVSFHKYWNSTDASTISGMTGLRNSYNVPLWCGESGENSNEWFYETIKMLQSNDIGWSWWPLKKISSIVGPATIVKTTEYQSLLNYWTAGGTKPTVDFATNTLLGIAENAKIENCIIHPDVMDAMFRQISSTDDKPFKKLMIPGSIYFSDFDMGSLNNAYWDTEYMNNGSMTQNNLGGAYRNDGVDIEVSANPLYTNGYQVTSIKTGEWMKYTVNIDSTGVYNLLVRAGTSNNPGGIFHIEDHGRDITGSIVDAKTGTDTYWKSIEIENIPLNKGIDTLRLYTDLGNTFVLSSMIWTGPFQVDTIPVRMLSANTNTDGTEVYMNFNKDLATDLTLDKTDFVLSKGTDIQLDTIVQSETDPRQIIIKVKNAFAFNDVLKLSYYGNTIISTLDDTLTQFENAWVLNNVTKRQFIPGKIEAESYDAMSGLTAESCSDVGGGQDMGYTDPGDYLEYNVFVQQAGNYTVQYRVASNNSSFSRTGELSFMDNGTKQILNTSSFPFTGGWQTWQTVTATVTLTAGPHLLRFQVIAKEFNLNYINFIEVPSGINNIHNSRKPVDIYPNPSGGVFYLNSPVDNQPYLDVEVFDINGRTCYKNRLENSGLVKVDLSNLQKGMYYMRIISGGQATSQKIIIE